MSEEIGPLSILMATTIFHFPHRLCQKGTFLMEYTLKYRHSTKILNNFAACNDQKTFVLSLFEQKY